MKHKRTMSRPKYRRFGFERLESRDLLTTVITNGVQVYYTNTVTTEQGDAIAIVVDFNPPFPLTPPQTPVTFTVYSTNTFEGTSSVASLTFTPQNYGNGQSIIVTGVDDPAPGVDDGPVTYGLAFGLMQSTDPRYNGKSIAAVLLANLDDDVQANGCVMPQSPIWEDSDFQTVSPCANDTDVGGFNIFEITMAGITQARPASAGSSMPLPATIGSSGDAAAN